MHVTCAEIMYTQGIKTCVLLFSTNKKVLKLVGNWSPFYSFSVQTINYI